MSLRFDAANSTYLSKVSTRTLAMPHTVGFWANVDNAANNGFCFSAVDSGGNVHQVSQGSSNDLQMTPEGAGGVANVPITSGGWHFILCRWISASSQRMSGMRLTTGVVSHDAATSSDLYAGTANVTYNVGGDGTSFLDGKIAEFWISNIDVYPGGGAATDSFVRQLALRGPLSDARVRNSLLEYYPMRHNILPSLRADEHFYMNPSLLKDRWVNNGGVRLRDHVPLPHDYVHPDIRPFNVPV